MTLEEAVATAKAMAHAIHGEWCSGEYDRCKSCAHNREAVETLEAMINDESPHDRDR